MTNFLGSNKITICYDYPSKNFSKQIFMSLPELIPLLGSLPSHDKLKAIQFLALALSDPETESWLSANLVDHLPEYDWGESGIPDGEMVHYVAGVGLVVGEGFG
jgi:hypothetical protein